MKKAERHHLICSRIRARMTVNSFNPTSLSVACGFDRNYVRSIFRGLVEPDRVFVPTHERLSVLARHLETTIDYIFGDTDDDSIDAVDPVPETTDEKKLLSGFRGLSEVQRKATLGNIGAMNPGIMIEVTCDHGIVLYTGPERRTAGSDADYDGPERRRSAHVWRL